MSMSEKGYNSVKCSQNFMKKKQNKKNNQVVHIMFANCMPDFMILAQEVLQIFMSQDCFNIDKSQRKDIIQLNIYRNF